MKRQTVYIGNSKQDFEKYCCILDYNNIGYKKIVINQSGRIPFGHGDLRSFGSNFSIVDSNIYEIMVSKCDYEKVRSLFHHK